ncbi:Cell Wall Hydrolase [Nitrosomonas aestuarii]|uniref:Cell Wall Hydrolase n=2 Tax=Nitrosomonas aestuarii TaxID=52441 RepID=A0A1I4GKJ6_9PROT|nr:Cell Wall Hydrolase [Nitrosomonas aestuarii]
MKRVCGSRINPVKSLSTHLISIAVCLALVLCLDKAIAADQMQKVGAVERKAEILEQKAATSDGKHPASAKIITRPEARMVDPDGEEPLDDALSCLARSIYWEARSEGIAGMQAIANVVMNRLGHEDFFDTICDVVMQGGEQGVCHFSWWCDGRSDDALEEKSYALAKEIARKALNQQLSDMTDGALYFHHHTAIPDWASEFIKTVKIGEHIFYKPPTVVTEAGN